MPRSTNPLNLVIRAPAKFHRKFGEARDLQAPFRYHGPRRLQPLHSWLTAPLASDAQPLHRLARQAVEGFDGQLQMLDAGVFRGIVAEAG